MLRLEDAVRLARLYAKEHGARWFRDPPERIVERPDYWFLRVGYIGSSGVIIDKASGRLWVMGSALAEDDFLWGHENGFSGNRSTLRVTAVRDLTETVEFLFYVLRSGPGSTRDPHPRRSWLQEQLRGLPRDFPQQPLWLRIPAFRAVRDESHWFDFEVTPEDETAGKPISLTEKTRQCLADAGWTEGRAWPRREWEGAVLAEGFVTSAAALEFLGRFGGLSMACSDARLDPVDAARGVESSWAVKYARRLGAVVSPVGTAFKGHGVIWITDDDRLCLSFDDDFRVIGDDQIDGLNALCEGDDYQVLRARRQLSAGKGPP